MVEDLDAVAYKFSLQNALEHDGAAQAGAVMGRVMASDPSFKSDVAGVKAAVARAIERVNGIALDIQRSELLRIAPELLEKKKTAKEKELPELDGAENGVVMRLAPNPSGPLHIGHTRMAILNDEYVKRYGGKLVVRMEDTNPPTILPEAYDLILGDLDWLDVKYHEVVNQSARFDLYYKHAAMLLEKGSAYMCECAADDWRAKKEMKRACPHRDTAPGDNLELWARMLDGDFRPGDISMVVKTDLEHPNPAVRDFVGLRLVDEPHPLTGDRYRVYPLYNFSVAVDDHLMGMTHVLRGKDHLNNTLRQEYVYEHLDWPKPVFMHYGWVSIDDTELSTRRIKASIEAGDYSGWNDARLGTVSALARRGIRPEAIRKYWIDVGTNAVDIKFSWQNLYAYNKELVDSLAKRYFFVWKPDKVVKLVGAGDIRSHAPLHPEKPEYGTREVKLSGEPIELRVVAEDVADIEPGTKIRFKDLCNAVAAGDNTLAYAGDDLAFIKQGAKIIHWVGPEAVKARVIKPDGQAIEGFVEKAALESMGEVVQFERFGFVKLEPGDEIEAFYAHN